jgi:hypothetical protein
VGVVIFVDLVDWSAHGFIYSTSIGLEMAREFVPG